MIKNIARYRDNYEPCLVSKARVMSPCQNFITLAFLVIVLLTVMVITAFAPDMLIYDEGNVYSCTADHLNEKLEEKVEQDEGKAY